MLTVGSLFSGIGGLDLGLERAGMKVIWQCEIDEYASKVLKKHWPDVPNLGDITKVDWKNVERPDLLCGGFPCQDISIAGKGAGIDGKRSGLWWEYLRAVSVLRPRYVLVENVPMLTRRGLDRLLASLSQIGYDAEWNIVSARQMGANHRRDRIFVVAYSGDRCRRDDERGGIGEPCFRELDKTEWNQKTTATTGPSKMSCSVAHSDESSGEGNGCAKRVFEERTDHNFHSWWEVEPNVGRVVDGIPSRVDRLRCLGNAVVPQVAEVVGRMIIEFDKHWD